ncbi:hypothetical protein AVEN_106035-1 [Araneus ventricosus]|uniref:Uncharacterized protein n=1 Tax=Araneus ventricosus TaxID=182803 RepID=A0A4Y2UBQ2_ARAVE|nr:hypothetical protein AVEN_106035-1 [Araneus ventricosus]
MNIMKCTVLLFTLRDRWNCYFRVGSDVKVNYGRIGGGSAAMRSQTLIATKWSQRSAQDMSRAAPFPDKTNLDAQSRGAHRRQQTSS